MENVDGAADVGHINLIGGLVTRNPPKNEQMDRKTRQMNDGFTPIPKGT